MENDYDKFLVSSIECYFKDKFSRNIEESFNNLEAFYLLVKEFQNNYFIDNKVVQEFRNVINILLLFENKFKNEYILDSSPNFAYDSYKNVFLKTIDNEEILRWIIHKVRETLAKSYFECNSFIDIKETLKKVSMADKCLYSSALVQQYCDRAFIKSKQIILYPGFTKSYNLFKGCGFHGFNIVTINDNNYIVDLTYRQFFIKALSSLERIGILNLSGPLAGAFMLLNKSRENTANRLLKEGYILMDDENMKNYFDGFALSWRNGTYYEKTEDYSYTTSYSPFDYKNFLLGVDNQVLHEGEEVLGYQKRILRNPNMRFKK